MHRGIVLKVRTLHRRVSFFGGETNFISWDVIDLMILCVFVVELDKLTVENCGVPAMRSTRLGRVKRRGTSFFPCLQ